MGKTTTRLHVEVRTRAGFRTLHGLAHSLSQSDIPSKVAGTSCFQRYLVPQNVFSTEQDCYCGVGT